MVDILTMLIDATQVIDETSALERHVPQQNFNWPGHC